MTAHSLKTSIRIQRISGLTYVPVQPRNKDLGQQLSTDRPERMPFCRALYRRTERLVKGARSQNTREASFDERDEGREEPAPRDYTSPPLLLRTAPPSDMQQYTFHLPVFQYSTQKFPSPPTHSECRSTFSDHVLESCLKLIPHTAAILRYCRGALRIYPPRPDALSTDTDIPPSLIS